MRAPALLTEIGRRLAAARANRGWSLAEVASRASVSSRYLRMAEGGEANLSLLKLASLARVLHVPLGQLCDLELSDAPPWRIALLGLRGAGKTTVGQALAQHLEVPFEELDQLVERRAGLPLAQLFALHGEGLYRELQGECLEQWLTQTGSGVLATGGSLVNDEALFRRLRSTCRTVWLRATPDEHWRRVVGQGDLRPMRDHPRARRELETLLSEREPRYALADLAVETTGLDPTDIVRGISRWASGGEPTRGPGWSS